MDKSEHTGGTFSRSNVVLDLEATVYVCPAGKELKNTTASSTKWDAAEECDVGARS
jgi:hypothetical protein